MSGGKSGICPQCKKKIKTVDYLATKCDEMLYHDKMYKPYII